MDAPLPPIEAATTALVVHDMQKDFIREEVDASDEMRAVVDRVEGLIDAAHDLSMPVVHTRVVNGRWNRYPSDRSEYLHYSESPESEKPCQAGTPGAEVIDELAPREEDIVVDKFRSSAFYDTGFDAMLRANDIWVLILVGGSINWGVEWLARDAKARDIVPIAVEDCTYTNAPFEGAKEASLATIDWCLGHVLEAEDVLDRMHA